MIDVGSSAHLLERAREQFFAEGDDRSFVETLVRPPILASWRRSALHGLKPSQAWPILVEAIEGDNQVVRAARPLIEDRFRVLTDLSACVTITDHHGCVLERWVDDARFARRLDSRGVVPGNSLAERDIGTCSSGIAIETGESTLVVGAEHFAEGACCMSTAGAPIHHPVGRQIVGTVNLTCSLEDTSPLMLAWIREIAARIETSILDSVTGTEQALLQHYLRSVRDSRHPVLCMNDTTIIGNAVAARMMDDVDLSTLWESASKVVQAGVAQTFELTTTTGDDSLEVVGEPIEVGSRVVGVRLRASRRRVAADEHPGAAASGVDPALVLPGLAGRSPAWLRLCAQLARLAPGEPVLLTGESGTGKTVAIAAMAPSAVVLDVQKLRGQGDDWLTRLKQCLDGDASVLALDGLHLLDPRDLAITFAMVAERVGGPRILAALTHEASDELNSQVDMTFPTWPGAVVRVPPLRERLGDVPVLLQALTAARTGANVNPTWTPDAVHTLTRVHWVGNVSSLGRVVSAVLRRSIGPHIRATDLPPSIRSMATRRQLSGLDLMEAHAISAALAAAEGNKKLAADRLGIARSTLYRKVRTLGIDLSSTAF
jgi:transcriptional regulator of acetoin/glycerol metabolism